MPENQYCASLSDLQTLIGDSEQDPKIALALRRASDRLIGLIGWNPHYVENDTVTLNGAGRETLLLPYMHITGAVIVQVDGKPVNDFVVDPRAGILRRTNYRTWPDSLSNITVICSHGYKDLPGDIQDAVLEQAEAQYRTLTGISNYSVGGRSITFGAASTVGVTQKWTDTVHKYSLTGSRA